MLASLKSEFRKLLTVRTTYFLTAFVFVVVALVAFYIQGYKLNPANLRDPMQTTQLIFGSLNSTLFGAIVAILIVTHEYRYNTILYTLTSARNRVSVLFSKLIVAVIYGIFLTLLITVISVVFSRLGIQASGNTLGPQTLNIGDILWRAIAYGGSYAIAGVIIATIVRSQVAAIAVLFVTPALIEPLLAQLLKGNAIYLPFSAQSQIIGNEAIGGTTLAPGKATLVFGAYLLLGWLVSCVLFTKRDAN